MHDSDSEPMNRLHIPPRGLVTLVISDFRWNYGALDSCGQATKGTWGMSWRQKPKKGVEDCDKPGVVVKRALIPGFPN